MSPILFFTAMIFLLVISVIDEMTYNKKKGMIPSFLTTVFLLAMFFLNQNVVLLVIAGLYGLFLTDLDFWKGIADFKVFVAASLAFSNPWQLLFFAGLLTVAGPLSKLVFLYRIKDVNAKVPFIPVIYLTFFVSFLITYFLKI